jgi:GWxTD domain-containing protein
MKKYMMICLLTICLLAPNFISATVTAYLTTASFNVPNKTPYVETYMSVIGHTVSFVKNAAGKYQGTVDISILFTQNGEVKNAQKYSLNSPEITDTLKGYPNFIDQQRYSLSNGIYDVEITIADKNKPTDKPLATKLSITVAFREDKVAGSDIQLLESYTKSVSPNALAKSGYDLMPYVSTYFPENINKIKFYSEFYNAKKILGEGQKVVLSYFLEGFESKVKLNDFSTFSKQTANDVNIALGELDIESLPTGAYNLVIELRDKENNVLNQQKIYVQRKNKPAPLSMEDLKSIDVSLTFVATYKSVDTLMGYLRCLRPISGPSDKQFTENQMKEKNLPLMQQYFYNFWKARYPNTAEQSWLDYYKEVQKVNHEFGTYGLKGYDTDRGRVYLQYGPPDQRTKSDVEPSAYPYEIWEYYTLTDRQQILTNPYNTQSGKKFVFYNPDQVTNKYMLIHSTAKGEIYNTRWELLLHSRDTQSNNLDDEKVPEHFGGNADDTFNNPR